MIKIRPTSTEIGLRKLLKKYTGKHFREMYERASRSYDQLAQTRKSSSKTQLD